jgi:hypothetical protein
MPLLPPPLLPNGVGRTKHAAGMENDDSGEAQACCALLLGHGTGPGGTPLGTSPGSSVLYRTHESRHHRQRKAYGCGCQLCRPQRGRRGWVGPKENAPKRIQINAKEEEYENVALLLPLPLVAANNAPCVQCDVIRAQKAQNEPEQRRKPLSVAKTRVPRMRAVADEVRNGKRLSVLRVHGWKMSMNCNPRMVQY